jgi:hypothetical protein
MQTPRYLRARHSLPVESPDILHNGHRYRHVPFLPERRPAATGRIKTDWQLGNIQAAAPMPITSPGNDDDTGENHQPTLRKNTAEPVEQTLKQNTRRQHPRIIDDRAGKSYRNRRPGPDHRGLPNMVMGGFCLIPLTCYTEYVHIKKKEETMKRYTINYQETYSGTFTIKLDDDSTEQDAINKLLSSDEFWLSNQLEFTDSDAEVTNVTTVKEA